MPECRIYREKLKLGKVPIIYLSGRHGTSTKIERDWLKRTNCKYRCFSYAYVCPGAFYYRKLMEEAYRENVAQGAQIMMDSSAHSFHKFVLTGMGSTTFPMNPHALVKKKIENVNKLKDETIERYVEFVKKEKQLWDFYVNFDYVKEAAVVYEMQHELEKMGIRPVPVFHGDDTLDWFKKYCDEGHKLIGIGSSNVRSTWDKKRFYFDLMFNEAEKRGVLLHGFAVTSMSLMFSYPWYSVDSSTWARTAAFGHILLVDGDRRTISQVHISDQESIRNKKSYNRMPTGVRKALADRVEKYGFDFQKLRTDLTERSVYNGWVFAHIEELGVTVREERVQWAKIL